MRCTIRRFGTLRFGFPKLDPHLNRIFQMWRFDFKARKSSELLHSGRQVARLQCFRSFAVKYEGHLQFTGPSMLGTKRVSIAGVCQWSSEKPRTLATEYTQYSPRRNRALFARAGPDERTGLLSPADMQRVQE